MVLKGEFGIIAVNNIPVVSSKEVAETFGKRHDHVLRDIRNLRSDDEEFWLPNFGESSYKNSQNKTQPEYLMTRDGFTILAMGFTGKKAMKFKLAYMNEFNRMQEAIRSRLSMRSHYIPMTDAIHDVYDNPQNFYYSNEANMINRMVLGMDAKHYREKYGLSKSEGIRDHMTTMERKLIDRLQIIDTGFIEAGMDYSIGFWLSMIQNSGISARHE